MVGRKVRFHILLPCVGFNPSPACIDPVNPHHHFFPQLFRHALKIDYRSPPCLSGFGRGESFFAYKG